MPTPTGQTSVFGVNGITDKEIWNIGIDVANIRKKTLYGRGDLASDFITDIGLSLDIDNTPPKHANIVNWPEDRVKRQQLALKLADNSNLVIVPE